MELQVEGRNLEIRKSWQEKIEEEKVRLDRHHPGLIHHLRVSIEETSGHKAGGHEVRMVATVPNETVIVKRKPVEGVAAQAAAKQQRVGYCGGGSGHGYHQEPVPL